MSLPAPHRPTNDGLDPAAARVRDIAVRLVEAPSETGTPDEAAFADRLVALLREIPYFTENPGDIAVLDSHGTPPRRNVVALVRGRGTRTLALAGHYDTVSAGNYRELAPLACRPDALSAALIAAMEGRALGEQEARALTDLQSGDFLPGRGMLDMKSGIAAGIAVLERFAENPAREGNLVLFATPDEERQSRGMRSLRAALPDLMARRGLSVVAGVNLDATSDQGEGAQGRAIYHGSIGKLMPFALVLGQASHASYPFEGVSAALIAAEIVRSIEADPELCDTGGGEVSPPPICLEARDLREAYEVTTPDTVWLAFNWLHHAASPAELFERFRARVEAATGAAFGRFRDRAARFVEKGQGPSASGRAPRVMSFADLKREALDVRGQAAADRFEALEASLAGLDNPLALSRRLACHLLAEAEVAGPLVVVGFAGLHYPAVRLDPGRPLDRDLLLALGKARAGVERTFGTTIAERPIFQGISDMSFLGTGVGEEDGRLLAENTPAAAHIDAAVVAPLVYPVVNIGPWGREFHQRLERVHMPYAFGVLPALLAAVAEALLSASPGP